LTSNMNDRSVHAHTPSRTAPAQGPTLRREIVLTHVAIAITLLAAVVSLGALTGSLVEHLTAHRWGAGLRQTLFIGIVGVLIYGGLVYQLARLGHLRRLLAHRPASEEDLHRFFHSPHAPAVTILVPSYKEDPQVIRRTLLSAALQDYPNRRLVLLVDDPPHPSHPADITRLTAARALPDEIQERLRKPAEHFADARDALLGRIARGPLDRQEEMQRLAQLYWDAAAWFDEQAVGYPVADHADTLFVTLTFERPARQCREKAETWAQPESHPAWRAQDLIEAYQRLATRFRLDVTSFERKQFVNLSHVPNKAMNLNSYIALFGKDWRIVHAGDGGRRLEPAGPGGADLSVPEADYVLMVDADSVIAPDYGLRLSHLLTQPGHEQIAVVQTPYSAFPNAPGVLERIAGATTDIQYIIHQGFTAYGATFWVGANALARTAALEDIAELDQERGYPIRRFIQDRTVIEDTESTIDLIAHGWRLHNYPDRLAFSATPPDFGSLLIQRRRWANGGLLILPKLCRYLARRSGLRAAMREGFMRSHYLASLAMVNTGLLVILALSFDDGLRTLWLPLTALPYYALYARDLRGAGYRGADVFRVFALNLLLIPVNLGGVIASLHQAWTGQKSPFVRTPKVQGRTAVPARYLIAESVLLVHWCVGMVFELVHGRPLHAGFALLNAAFLAYAIACFIGLRESWQDLAARAAGAGLIRFLIGRARLISAQTQRSPYAP
jgi:cellulose synthase/poly-beta-1,6-N-acetylglucosamine synthase-like glycosyltransferase